MVSSVSTSISARQSVMLTLPKGIYDNSYMTNQENILKRHSAAMLE